MEGISGMFKNLSANPADFLAWNWEDIEPYYRSLTERELDAGNVQDWLSDWSEIAGRVSEMYQRLYVATTVNTEDSNAHQRYEAYLDGIYPKTQEAEQQLKEKLLASGLEPANFAIPLRNLRTQAELFRQENLPLQTEELKLSNEYDKLIGAQTVAWGGGEVTLSQLQPVYQEVERERREQAWRLAAERQLADRQAINELWVKYLDLRQQMARNAGFEDYRSFRWRQYQRFDYTPQDCRIFHAEIEQVVVPAARQVYENRRQRLGVERLRPWDLFVDPGGRPPLRPFNGAAELIEKTAAIFQQVDPQLGEYFEVMRREGLLDLDNRKGKAPGGYCTEYAVVHRPFIFMNAVGIHDDVQTLLHEGGHSFHVFESAGLPYLQQRDVPMEFAEVASMAMELLASPYLGERRGGFYNEKDAARARSEHLESSLLFWPYMAVVDAFQHWVYENPEAAREPANCDAYWSGLWDRFMVGIDWSGLEQEKATGWQRKLHIHQAPFYYIEYGLALLGAVQVFRNARRDQQMAVSQYRQALSLGGTVGLPELFATAGAKFAFDAGTLQEAVALMMTTLEELAHV
jgi:oligoendopeptidase F